MLKGSGLLAGLLRCRRCGRKLDVGYGGKGGKVPRYECRRNRLMKGEWGCLAFGGWCVDEATGREVLRLVERFAIDAALQLIEARNNAYDDRSKLLELELQSAGYETNPSLSQSSGES